MSGEYVVEAYLSHKDGKFVLTKEEGIVPVLLWAKIIVKNSYGGWRPSGLFISDDFNNGETKLEGDAAEQAWKILNEDDDWQVWLAQEIFRQSGYWEGPYDAITSRMVM